jgi:hypothetical protein
MKPDDILTWRLWPKENCQDPDFCARPRLAFEGSYGFVATMVTLA